MKIGKIDTDKEVLVVAEIGNNHEGNPDVAKKLIDAAAASGVQAVKFQTYITEYYVGTSNKARYDRLKSFELGFKTFEQLQQHTLATGLTFLSTPFDLESAKFLNGIVPAFKISSSDNNFYPLLEYVAATGKPILLSSGLADIEQLKKTEAFIKEVNRNAELAILHCVTSYPVKNDEANVAAISDLKRNFKHTIGYSDHTMGIDAALLAVALEAQIIEKHFTLDKNYSDFRDHQISADPPEMKLLVEKVKVAKELLGSGIKQLQNSEKEIETAVRRSIVAKHDLKSGQIISGADITWTRPGGGIAPGQEGLVIGKKLTCDLKTGEPITLNAFR